MGKSLEQELALEIEELRRNHGFKVISTLYTPESFGNSTVVLESASLRIRLIRDRGEIGIDLASRVGDEWHMLETVLEAAGVVADGIQLGGWDSQLDLLTQHLPDIEFVVHEPNQTTLRRLEREKAERRLRELTGGS